ncbi:hypothetical protein Taro_017578 [Colocasia esculenta]|uniref:non-specific serine/threonine protein kinase n=1 Tax=Colocasia esculenta TaxID=4460 RepID=A0A843UWH3_COLES|nr:hypothetical protein [Colocasia esculenta]
MLPPLQLFSVLPSGLNCLQRGIPCNRFLPIYSSFGIKCGGSRAITASDGTQYEVDDQNLTAASYYVVDTQKWGGRLREKDFDIRGKAGGSNRAVVENYIAPVTDNFLEIHLFWAGRGTCRTPTQGYYGPAISAISIAPYDFNSTVRNQPLSTSREKKKTGFIVGIAVGIAALCALFILVIFLWRLRRKKMDWDDDEGKIARLSFVPDCICDGEREAEAMV